MIIKNLFELVSSSLIILGSLNYRAKSNGGSKNLSRSYSCGLRADAQSWTPLKTL